MMICVLTLLTGYTALARSARAWITYLCAVVQEQVEGVILVSGNLGLREFLFLLFLSFFAVWTPQRLHSVPG